MPPPMLYIQYYHRYLSISMHTTHKRAIFKMYWNHCKLIFEWNLRDQLVSNEQLWTLTQRTIQIIPKDVFLFLKAAFGLKIYMQIFLRTYEHYQMILRAFHKKIPQKTLFCFVVPFFVSFFGFVLKEIYLRNDFEVHRSD